MTRDIFCLLPNFKFLTRLIRHIIQAHLSAFSNKKFYNAFVTVYYRHCATSRMVSGSIPGGVNGDFFRSYRRNHVPWGRLSL